MNASGSTDRDDLTAADREQLVSHGIRPDEAQRQLALLRNPPPKTRLVRPARLGDGISRLPEGAEADRLAELGLQAAEQGRMVRFVPASGAASRLFAELREARAAGYPPDHPALVRLGRVRDRLPFDCAPEEILGRHGDSPKALVPFHRYPGRPARPGARELRTALEEHLVEAAGFQGGRGTARLHFSVAARHQPAFEALLTARVPALERRLKSRFEITVSRQAKATDSLAIDAEGAPFRVADDPAASLLLRPGGHGALLGNLQALADRGFELVGLKNIDNVQPEHAQGAAVNAMQVLAGMTRELAAQSNRPARVCGFVRAVGQAGGGPFRVAPADGAASVEPQLQIVETSQVDLDDAEQAEILARSTHFNPVFLVCSVRSSGGSAYRLEDFVDHDASFIVRKRHDARELVSFERPGLWNGSMAGWETRFVELPEDIYTPVKSVFDLADTAHQPEGRHS